MKKVFKIEDYSGKYVMHCKTREESDKFCKYLDSIGRTWSDGSKYTEWEHWGNYRENTCYNFNERKYDQVDWYKSKEWTILEFSDFMWPEFTKSDLKDGMVVEYRNGSKRLVLNGNFVGKDNWCHIDDYTDDLINTGSAGADIDVVKVYKTSGHLFGNLLSSDKLTLIWERKPTHKYKVGDKVRVREDLKVDRTYSTESFIDRMEPFRGKAVTIEYCCSTPGEYRIKECGFWWTDEMFEGLVDYEEMTVAEIEKKLGYKIKVVGNDA